MSRFNFFQNLRNIVGEELLPNPETVSFSPISFEVLQEESLLVREKYWDSRGDLRDHVLGSVCFTLVDRNGNKVGDINLPTTSNESHGFYRAEIYTVPEVFWPLTTREFILVRKGQTVFSKMCALGKQAADVFFILALYQSRPDDKILQAHLYHPVGEHDEWYSSRESLVDALYLQYLSDKKSAAEKHERSVESLKRFNCISFFNSSSPSGRDKVGGISPSIVDDETLPATLGSQKIPR